MVSPGHLGAPALWERDLGRMQTDESLREIVVQEGPEGLPSLCLPILPPLGRLKVPPSRTNWGGGGNAATVKHVTHRQMSPPPSAAVCKAGESSAWWREAGTVSPQEEAQPLNSTDTDTNHQVLWGQRGDGHRGINRA